MKMQWAWILPVLTILTLSGPAWAQGYPQGYPPGYQPGSPPPGSALAGYDPSVMMYAPPDAMSGYGQQAGYFQPEGEPTPAGPMPGYDPGAPYGGEGYEEGQPYAEDFGVDCPYCGGAGCGRCSGHHGLLGDVLGLVGPYPDGGCGAVRWYDLSVDYMLLKRDNVGRTTNFTSQGIAGPIVLSTDSLNFDASSSFRFTGAIQCGPGSSAEFVYYGLFWYESQSTVTDPNGNLFSAFSNFGTLPFNGFAETDNSDLQAIRYTSKFDNFEVNFRQRWVAPSNRYQGSWLIGVRYFKLDEQFSLLTQSTANQASLFYDTDVFNSLTGLQVGGDIWFCVLPGLRIGGETKAGIYGNNAGQNSSFSTTSGAFLQENAHGQDAAFVTDTTLMATYRINYQWTAKIGYHFLYVDGVALATENFNTTPPAIFFPPPGVNRTLNLNDNGNVFYHGIMAGLEFMW
jgi:hypothetical protein